MQKEIKKLFISVKTPNQTQKSGLFPIFNFYFKTFANLKNFAKIYDPFCFFTYQKRSKNKT